MNSLLTARATRLLIRFHWINAVGAGPNHLRAGIDSSFFAGSLASLLQGGATPHSSTSGSVRDDHQLLCVVGVLYGMRWRAILPGDRDERRCNSYVLHLPRWSPRSITP